jgi:hypothetical protein
MMYRQLLVSSAALLALLISTHPAGARQSAGAAEDPVARALERVLDGARDLNPGAYLVGADVHPSTNAVPVLLQADAYRGADLMTRVSLVLGATVSRPSAVAVRAITRGASPRVAAQATSAAQIGSTRLVREFALEPGEYDVAAAIGSSDGSGVTVTLAKSTLQVPNLTNGSLAASPLVLGDNAAAVAQRGAPRAFVFGATGLTPAVSNHFQQAHALHLGFRIYNWAGDTGAPPDLTVEYVFYQQVGSRLRFFNKIKPQPLQAQTLGSSFDPAAHVVSTGMTIPLSAFPFGEFEVTARVVDNRSKQRITRQVRFHVGT